MKEIVSRLYLLFFHLGGLGLLALGTFDSSILFMPLANDLLMVALAAKRPRMLPYYAAMAAAGSVLGCLITDAISRKGGEEGLEKHLPHMRLEYVKKRVKERAAWALAFASLIPPPFPFTAFVAAAAALQYPRKKIVGVIALARFVRFSIEGLLAVVFGTQILKMAESSAVQSAIVGLTIVSIGGSAVSIYYWARRSRRAATS